MFETFAVPSLAFGDTANLALISSGRTTGLVLDSGHTITSAVPVYEGTIRSKANYKTLFGGNNLAEYLAKLLKDSTKCNNSQALSHGAKDILKKSCYVALN